MARFAVLTVYYADPNGCRTVDTATAGLVAGLVAATVIDDPGLACLDDAEPWPCLNGHPRELVAVAIGTLTAALHIDTTAALALLRARAVINHRTVDDVAADLVHG